MADRTELSVMTHLLETCRDGEHGFRFAAEHASSPDLRDLFTTLAAERERFAEELVPHLYRLGGQAASAGSTGATVHRGWMSLMSRVTGHEDHVLIAEAERGERHAIQVYADALRGMLPPDAVDLVERQQANLREAYARIVALDRARNLGV